MSSTIEKGNIDPQVSTLKHYWRAALPQFPVPTDSQFAFWIQSNWRRAWVPLAGLEELAEKAGRGEIRDHDHTIRYASAEMNRLRRRVMTPASAPPLGKAA